MKKKLFNYNLILPLIILWAFIGMFVVYLFNLNPGINGIKDILLFGFLWGVFGGGFLLYFRSSIIGFIAIIGGTLWCIFEIVSSGKSKNDALIALVLFLPMIVILEVFGYFSKRVNSSEAINKAEEITKSSSNEK